MPFTISHIAGIVPLARREGIQLPFAAMAIGSMAPDLLYFVPGLINYGSYLHRPAYSFTIGLILALGGWMLWRILAPGIHNICPDIVRKRWNPDSWNSYKAWRVILAIQIGIATHLLFDSFTHSWGWGVNNIGALEAHYITPFGPPTGYEIAQNLMSGLGLIVLAIVALRLPSQNVQPSKTPKAQRAALWLVPLAGIMGAIVRTAAVGGSDSRYEALAFYLLTGAVAAGLVVVVVLGGYSSLVSIKRVRARGVRVREARVRVREARVRGQK